MKTKSYPILEIKKSLKRIEAEVIKLKKFTQGIPGVQKTFSHLSFMDILKFHLNDREDND